ncbi:hypothetical protein PARPLA_01245 [Rhodobacteraceae bacterium THAF1]|uniref:copper chaperone PCu(A)C n=1 Tax=Palleronia sp. THAF1 TaxID=2587842 RepID=UPI000F3DBEF1|nr:copper chaperone PCu(A)C [Palleronia sp. THAF1]QFU07234.1 hypothetical protein FIU81_00955 [Palleronia sp. THAF1]VDC20866.1 hypothetical protein PARPLA_01245 [Rhodobacteraceae bacterium THAF1]
MTILASLAATASLSNTASAGTDDIVVEEPWARASIGKSRPGAAYLTLRNVGAEPVTLTAVETPVAMMAEVHLTETDERGISTMSPAGEITVAPGENVSLEPGGLHAMLMKLQEPMKEGETVPMTLIFSDGVEIEIEVPVLGIAARGPEG